MKKVLIRADATQTMGAGHVMRSSALAQYLNCQNIYVRFLTATNDKELTAYLNKQKFEIRFIVPPKSGEQHLLAISQELKDGFDWVILDSYELGEEHHKKIRESNVHLLAISDCPPYSKHADLILNHGVQEKSDDARHLFGTKYALIRQDLVGASRKEKKGLQNILVTLGGCPHVDLLKKIVAAINLITESKLNIKVLSGFSGEGKEIKTVVGQHEIEYRRSSFDIQHLFNWADLAFSAAGGTSLELCFFGIVGIIGIVADNQIQIAHHLNQNGIFKSIGWYKNCSEAFLAEEFKKLLVDTELMAQMRARASRFVDGKGPERVFRAMQEVERAKIKK